MLDKTDPKRYTSYMMKKVLAFVFTALLLMPSLAKADGLTVANVVLAGAGSADMWSTHHFLTKYSDVMEEANPAIAWMQSKPTVMLATGATVEAAAVLLGQRLLKNHRKLAIVATYSLASIHATLAVRNMQMANRHARLNSIPYPLRVSYTLGSK